MALHSTQKGPEGSEGMGLHTAAGLPPVQVGTSAQSQGWDGTAAS